MRERKSNAGGLLFVLLAFLILFGVWLYAGWQSARKVLPAGMTMAGLPVGGMTREQALEAVAQAFASPVTVFYDQETILLVPEMVDLALDREATAANLDQLLTPQSGPRGFITYGLDRLLRRQTPPQEIKVVFSYSRERVDAFLQRVARQYDRESLAPVALPEVGSFRPAQAGRQLDLEASRPLLIEALLSATRREVTLVVNTESAPATSTLILQQALAGRLADFTGVAGIFVKDLQTGQETCLNCETAFSGLSTVKLALLTAVYASGPTSPDAQTLTLMSTALTETEPTATNTLLSQLGGGDPTQGAEAVTTLLKSIGLNSTFLAGPYGVQGATPPSIVTPANSRTDLATQPDPYLQTTPMEMGLLLEGIYQCAHHNGGTLQLLYPQQITPEECQTLLTWLSANQTRPLLQAELPAGTQVAYLHSWGNSTHAEVALIFSPGGDFVLTTFLYQPQWLVWEEAAPTFAAIGKLSYRFFNPEE